MSAVEIKVRVVEEMPPISDIVPTANWDNAPWSPHPPTIPPPTAKGGYWAGGYSNIILYTRAVSVEIYTDEVGTFYGYVRVKIRYGAGLSVERDFPVSVTAATYSKIHAIPYFNFNSSDPVGDYTIIDVTATVISSNQPLPSYLDCDPLVDSSLIEVFLHANSNYSLTRTATPPEYFEKYAAWTPEAQVITSTLNADTVVYKAGYRAAVKWNESDPKQVHVDTVLNGVSLGKQLEVSFEVVKKRYRIDFIFQDQSAGSEEDRGGTRRFFVFKGDDYTSVKQTPRENIGDHLTASSNLVTTFHEGYSYMLWKDTKLGKAYLEYATKDTLVPAPFEVEGLYDQRFLGMFCNQGFVNVWAGDTSIRRFTIEYGSTLSSKVLEIPVSKFGDTFEINKTLIGESNELIIFATIDSVGSLVTIKVDGSYKIYRFNDSDFKAIGLAARS